MCPASRPCSAYARPARSSTLDEHIFVSSRLASDAGLPLRVRLAALLHELGKRAARADADEGPTTREQAAELADAASRAFAIPTRCEGAWPGS